ncbi:MAG: molybdate ABC transporter substrate-binding protein [Lachnospiraceae bacterium]|nr:molybdate ABC transporter substrate-binding protein [Lachnospiraceae bacterium]
MIASAACVFALGACGNTTPVVQTTEPAVQETAAAAAPAATETEKAADAQAAEAATPTEEAQAETESVGEGEIIVFAAASMTETLTELKDTYEAAHPEVTITYNFDSSGTLKTQIQEGADCDLFISAGQKQMNQLDSNASAEVNTEGLDFVDANSRINILENKVTLCVPEENPKNLQTFDDLADALKGGDILFCMGNADVPVGQYTQKILAYYELDEEQLAADGVITYGSNVKEVTTQVAEGSVDAGVIYCTDAYSAGLTIMDYATKDMCGQIIYPAAVLKTASNPEAAQYFLDFLTTDEAMEVFEKVGFSRVN